MKITEFISRCVMVQFFEKFIEEREKIETMKILKNRQLKIRHNIFIKQF
jgi:hypothetical protein